MRMPGLFTLLAAVFMILAGSVSAQDFAASEDDKYVKIELFTDKTTVAPGESVTVGIRQIIADGWHTYWINPGDSGEATSITWSGIEALKTGDIQYPAPKKLPLGPLTNYGFEGAVTLLQDITFPDTLPEGPVNLQARIDLLVCEEICLPETTIVDLDFNTGRAASPVAVETARAALPSTVQAEAQYEEIGEDIVFTLSGERLPVIENLSSLAVFPVQSGLTANAAPSMAERTENGYRITQKAGEIPANQIEKNTLVLTYNQGGSTQAFKVEAELAGSAAGQSGAAALSFGPAILFAFLGGLLLNLMPCVFPVLSLKALSLANLKDKEEGHARLSALAYGAGILISFLVLAGILIGLKNAGQEIGWGFQLQDPLIVLGFTYVVFLLGLNLSGLFEFRMRFMNAGASLTQKSGLSGSFFTGVLATVIATPCTVPFIAPAIGFALAQPAILSLSVFCAMAAGLALPYMLICYIPALRRALPRPGAWMENFKQFLAFPMYATALWLAWVLGQQVEGLQLLFCLMGLVGVALAVWMAGKARGSRSIKVMAAIIALLSISPALSLSMPDRGAINAVDYSEAAYSRSLSTDRPVFVNMTAAWCITCKYNERVALTTKATQSAFHDNNVIYIKGDWTNRDDSITRYLARYGRAGVPLYVYYGAPDADTGERPEPVVLPQLLTGETVRSVLIK